MKLPIISKWKTPNMKLEISNPAFKLNLYPNRFKNNPLKINSSVIGAKITIYTPIKKAETGLPLGKISSSDKNSFTNSGDINDSKKRSEERRVGKEDRSR